MNKDLILKEIDNIEKILKDRPHYTADPFAIKEIEKACFSIRVSDIDFYIREKVTSILEFASILFSANKHKKYGENRVHNFVLSDCSTIKSYVNSYKESN